jgi:hypothetical protein
LAAYTIVLDLDLLYPWVADPGRGAERFSERLLSCGPDTWKRFWICVLRDAAWGPRVKAGTNVPSYSGGLAACTIVLDLDFL